MKSLLHIIKMTIYGIHFKMPLWLRRLYAPLFHWRYLKVWRTYFKTYLPVYVFKGFRPGSDIPFCLAYAGEEYDRAAYWCERAFKPGFKEHQLGRFWFLNIPHALKESHFTCDMVFVESNAFTEIFLINKPGLRVPFWVQMNIDITPSMDDLIKKSKSGFSDINRRIRKNSLDYKVSNDPKEFEDYYFNMHKKFIKDRFNQQALFNSDETAKEMFKRSVFILVTQKGENLGGVLVEKNHGIKLRVIGIKDGDPKYIQQGVLGALYYFSILHMKDKGYKELDVGGTPPVLTDGLTQFKKRLLGKVIPCNYMPKEFYKILFLNDSPGLKDFLTQNPLIFRPADNIAVRAIFIGPKQFKTKEEFQKALRASDIEGIHATTIYLFEKDNELFDWIKNYSCENFKVSFVNSLMV